jgi:hypothetical protein
LAIAIRSAERLGSVQVPTKLKFCAALRRHLRLQGRYVLIELTKIALSRRSGMFDGVEGVYPRHDFKEEMRLVKTGTPVSTFV